jgi:hypothetical protein
MSRGLAFVSGRNGAHGIMRNFSWSADGKTVVYQKPVETKPLKMLTVFSRDPNFLLYRTGNVSGVVARRNNDRVRCWLLLYRP